jgi:hypothetical protein
MNLQTPAIRLLLGGWEDNFPLQHKAQPHYFPAGRFQPGLLLYPEFPKIIFAGNSSRCIKTAIYEGHQYYRSLPMLNLYSGLPSQPKKLISRHLSLLSLVTLVE